MASLAATAFAALAGGGGAAAGATAAAGAVAASSGVLTTLQTVATVASVASTLLGGFSAYSQGRTQAEFADINAESERLAAEERALRIRRQLVERVAQNRVAFAASGQDISAGGDIENALVSDADFEEGLALTSGRIAAAGQRAQAATYRARGVTAGLTSLARAGGTIANTAIDIAKRG